MLAYHGRTLVDVETERETGVTCRGDLTDDGVTIRFTRKDGDPAAAKVTLRFKLSPGSLICRLSDKNSPDALLAASGPAKPSLANAIYDPKDDLAIEMIGADLSWDTALREMSATVYCD